MTTVEYRSIEKSIDHLLALHRDAELRELLLGLSQEEIAHAMNRLAHGKKKIFQLLANEMRQKVIWDLNQYSRKYVIASLSRNQVRELVTDMDSDDASDVIHLLPPSRQRDILKTLKKEDSEHITEILQYPEKTAGHLMQKELLKVPEYFSILDCMKRVQNSGQEVNDLQTLFVTDSKGRLLGTVPILQLIMQKPQLKIKNVATDSVRVPVSMDQEDVAHLFKESDATMLPVVDSAGVLVGRITLDDVVDVMEEEQSEDMYQMAGITGNENIFDTPLHSIRKRLPWLTVNVLTAILVASVVASFEGTIQRIAILAAYMPIVAGMGGNAATQVVTVVVRSIALGEVEFKDVSRVLLKEMAIGLLNGLILGTLIGSLSFLYNANIMLGVVVGLAMITNLFIAGVMGTLIPLTLRALRLDPALASSVFVTACTDMSGFFAFLGLATLLL